MFTGIIEDLGVITLIEHHTAGARLRVQCDPLVDFEEGMSIAVNGVCLTAVDVAEDSFSADLSPETLQRTNLGDLSRGARVNLEWPVTPETFLSGHIVQGHVDGTGTLIALDPLGDGNWWLKMKAPVTLDRYMIHKGSVAIDGISLTIASLEQDQQSPGPIVGVAIIPHTYENTTLRAAQPGARLNIEVDVLAKYVEKLFGSALRSA